MHFPLRLRRTSEEYFTTIDELRNLISIVIFCVVDYRASRIWNVTSHTAKINSNLILLNSYKRIIVKKEQVWAKNGWTMFTHMDEQENGSADSGHTHTSHNAVFVSSFTLLWFLSIRAKRIFMGDAVPYHRHRISVLSFKIMQSRLMHNRYVVRAGALPIEIYVNTRKCLSIWVKWAICLCENCRNWFSRAIGKLLVYSSK